MSKLVTFICSAFDLINEFSMMRFRSAPNNRFGFN